MWTDILINYGVFILKIITVVVAIVIIVTLIFSLSSKTEKSKGELKLTNLVEIYKEQSDKLKNFRLTDAQAKKLAKEEKKAKKKEEKAAAKNNCTELKPCLYVLNFKGDMHASQVGALREEISAILSVAKPNVDKVLLRLESPGGVVHGYGLAASQLQRIKDHNIKLIIAVDKVAASGGYMMACIADEIVAAPFAILGSIGVVAQVPNIHKLLKKNDIDVDVMTAGEYKRTVTLLGEKTEKGTAKFQEELEQTHNLFKNFVAKFRPQLDMEQIATGEHWFGQQAIEYKLIDRISTSDTVILDEINNADIDIVEVAFSTKKSLLQRVSKQVEVSLDNIATKLLHRNNSDLYL